jgi:hypothetical protein
MEWPERCNCRGTRDGESFDGVEVGVVASRMRIGEEFDLSADTEVFGVRTGSSFFDFSED